YGNDQHNGQSAGAGQSAALSAGSQRPELPNAYVAPQTTLQEVILTVWSSILGIEKIGIEDDFFELGGDSVLATQIISRLSRMFRMDLPPIVLFDASTIDKLAHYIIAHEARPGLAEKTAAVLKRIEGMTEEEVTRSLLSR
ncbi:MAG: phosphopantetheine-binding protein, partial [Terriglobales bacterium]